MTETNPPLQSFRLERLSVTVYPDRAGMSRAAAAAAAESLRSLLSRQAAVRAIFACAPSQDLFLAALTREPNIAWDRVTAFHMDEYVGLAPDHPASFRRYLHLHLTSQVPLACVHELAGDAPDIRGECSRYAGLLDVKPIDFVFLGIGENGHLAFNDPPVADFHDPQRVKPVELDHACRLQQVNDGCYATLDQVPRRALTLTIPVLLGAARLFCIVPGRRKAAAVAAALHGPLGCACPASVLRTHQATELYLDRDSAAQLNRASLTG